MEEENRIAHLVKIMRKCSRLNCNNIGQFKSGGSGTLYCYKHYRFKCMAVVANKRYGSHLVIDDIENLYNEKYNKEKNPRCSGCGKVMIWHTKLGNRRDVISLHHWENDLLGFLCVSCNSRHGTSTNVNVLNVSKNNKWCSACKTIKNIKEFGKDKAQLDGLNNNCRSCNSKMASCLPIFCPRVLLFCMV